MNYYISDLHFGHKNILKFDNRPFDTVEEMEEVLINNWNSTVSKNDTTYILGDFCWSKDTDIWRKLLYRLNGSKTLILGNHDLTSYPSTLKNCFADIKDYKEIKDNGNTVIMSHYPILCYKHDYDPNCFMLFGHVHVTKEWNFIKESIEKIRNNRMETYDNRCQAINVGCMMPWMNYTPRTLKELTEALDRGEMY